MPAESSKPRGELGEIRATLAGLSSSGNKPEALLPKREVFKKIINYSTVSLRPCMYEPCHHSMPALTRTPRRWAST